MFPIHNNRTGGSRVICIFLVEVIICPILNEAMVDFIVSATGLTMPYLKCFERKVILISGHILNRRFPVSEVKVTKV